MRVSKQFFFAVGGALPTKWLDRISDIPVLLPYHHVVSDEYIPHIKGLYNYKNKKQFLQDLEWLLRYRKPVHPDELSRCILEQKPFSQRTFLLTFDDGFREVYDVIAPLLTQKGIPAIFFINPTFVDNKQLFYRCKLSLIIEKLRQGNNEKLAREVVDFLSGNSVRFENVRKKILEIHYPEREKADQLGDYVGISFEEYLRVHQPFMTTSQLKELHEKGFTLGAHSMDHPHYGLIGENEQLLQTTASLQFVNEISGSGFQYFSFPHEDKPVRQSFFSSFLKERDNSKIVFFGTQKQLKERNNHMLHRFNAEEPQHALGQSAKAVALYNFLKQTFKAGKVQRL